MSAHAYTEDQLVEQPAIGLFAEPGWQTVPALEETFGTPSPGALEELSPAQKTELLLFVAQSVCKEQARQPDDPNGFYQRILTHCWREAHRVLKPGGILAFTFHDSEDEPWVRVLESLFLFDLE